jgi:penicillin-binding protein 1C
MLTYVTQQANPQSLMKHNILRISITIVLLLVSMVSIIFFLPLPPLLADISYSSAVFSNDGHLLRLTLSVDSKYRLQAQAAELPPALIKAVLLEEDQYFYWHMGVNPISMIKAALQTYLLHSRRMGASTITMQVARMRYRIRSKTFSGKLLQLLRALQIEMHYSKQDILTAYFNLAPYGHNIEGISAASLIYFNKPVEKLMLPEMLTLVVIPQNPQQRIPDKFILKSVRDKLFMRWIKLHPADKNKIALINLPLQIRHLHQVPFLAPHFSEQVLAESHQHYIISTLDLHLQQLIEQLTRRYLARKKNLGIDNAAVMLVDSRNMEVKALLGSANFFDNHIGGQINGTLIKRSPGSTLKPFIYALAIDQGLIHPDTMLKDVPRSFGSYNPENFDNDFVGPIKAKDALILSRNVPAVFLADQLKKPSLYEFLQAANITHLKSENYYGLALVLGGAELSMQELVKLYCVLANDGMLRDVKITENQPVSAGKRLLSPEAAFLILDMLKNTEPPNGFERSETHPIAWKTGTSSGYRDAWSIGIVGPYVLAVWIGNFDNQSNPALIGKEMAAPLFFSITTAMTKQMGQLPVLAKFPERMQLKKINVCKTSGMLPTRYCQDTEPVWFIPGKSPIHADTIYREVAINHKTGLRTCHINENTRFEIYEFWSSDLLKIFKRAGIARRTPPAYEPDCQTIKNGITGFSPQILSPNTQVNYILGINETVSHIPLTAVADADVQTLHWFANANYLGQTSRDQSFFWQAKPGKYVIRVVDDAGRADAKDIQVKRQG